MSPIGNPPEDNGVQHVFSQPPQQNLPNASLVLILGILSIVFSIWYLSFAGIVLSIVALVLANRDMAVYRAHSSRYTLSSFNNLKAGRICAMIGLVVAVLFFIIILLLILGLLVSIPFWGMIG